MRNRLLQAAGSVLTTVLIGGFLAATLVRMAPGYGIDEREMDPRFSREAIGRMRANATEQRALLPYYWHFLVNAIHGDLGYSAGFRRPAAELIAERFPVTARAAGLGLAGGWALGLLVALFTVVSGNPGVDVAAGAIPALLLCVPSSVIALAFMILGGGVERYLPAAGVLGVVIFARILVFARSILRTVAAAPHVLQARAKGLSPIRIALSHVLWPAAPQLLALLGVSVSMAFGLAIPVEVVCDAPGLGQLAWQAALKRDLPLLIDITLLITILVGVSGLAAEVSGLRPTVRDVQ